MKKLVKVITLVFLLFAFTISFSFAQTHRKWSHRKKDAVIGGIAGAGTGALISHDHSKGAMIGGVLGAGAGYLHGRHKDKQAGRLRK